MSASSKTLVFVYEAAQVPQVLAYLEGTSVPTRIVALDLWASEAMRERNVEHVLYSDYVLHYQHPAEVFARLNTLAREWHRIPEMSFFAYRGVPIAESVEAAFEVYFGKLWLACDAIRTVLDAHPKCDTIVMPHTTVLVSHTTSVTALYDARAFADAAVAVGAERGITVQTSGIPPQRDSGLMRRVSPLRSVALGAANALTAVFAPRKPLKIFASDYWSALSPFIADMNDVELVLMDRSEIKKIPWKQIWKHRIRFIHPHDQTNSRIRSVAEERRARYEKEWENVARPAVEARFNELIQGTLPWLTVEPAFTFLVTEFSERIVADIEATRVIYAKHKINRVLERASVSAQHHFFVLPQVAYTMGIPAIEVQHGCETIASYSLYSRLKCGYIAAYGSCMRSRMEKDHAYTPGRVVPIGSPRFDAYNKDELSDEERMARIRALGLDPTRPIVMVAAPLDAWYMAVSYFRSFEVGNLYKTVRNLQDSVTQLQFIIKFRHGYGAEPQRRLIAHLFKGASVVCTDQADIKSLFQISDVLVSTRTTMMYESVLQGVPVVLFPVREGDRPFTSFFGQGFPICTSEGDFLMYMQGLFMSGSDQLKDLYMREADFLKCQYSFDGSASERMRTLMRMELEPQPASDATL